MYNRQINADLYNRIEEEFSEYEKELWLRSPEVILSQADEYIIKRDIVRYLLDNNLPTNKAEALFVSTNPLNDMYVEYLDSEAETRYMSYIENCINKTADKALKRTLDSKIADASSRSEEKSKEATKEPLLSREDKDKEK